MFCIPEAGLCRLLAVQLRSVSFFRLRSAATICQQRVTLLSPSLFIWGSLQLSPRGISRPRRTGATRRIPTTLYPPCRVVLGGAAGSALISHKDANDIVSYLSFFLH